jgi:thioredoxin 1
MNNPSIITLKDSDFEEVVLKSDIPVLVDFWAEWCGPCKMLAPLLDSLASASEYQGKIKICKVNVDENKATAAKYNVRGIPTLILFKDGKAQTTKTGALSKSQLEAFVKNYL